MRNLIIVIVVSVLGVGAYYLFFRNNPAVTQTSDNQAPAENDVQTPAVPASDSVETAATPPAPASVSVSIKNFAYDPATLTVKTGTKVTWTNNDNAPHTVTSDSGKLLDSPTLSSGQSFSFTFTAVGTNSYYCAIHPTMKAKVIVTD